ncbi:glycosyltransferase [Acetobacter tropicalis]|nr:glycosyltransferase [Acetobacter tropicalis]
MLTVLHTLICPEADIEHCAEMYFRGGMPGVEASGAGFSLPDNVLLSADTFYNGLSVGKWKSLGTISSLSLMLRVRGQLVLELWHYAADGASSCLQTHEFEEPQARTHVLPVPEWSGMAEGMLFLRLKGKKQAVVEQLCFATDAPPLMQPKLGVVITHFNRVAYVTRSIARVRQTLLSDPRYQRAIDFIVVDNSDTLDPTELKGAQIIPNQNYGGSGGFARGLLYLKDQNTYTHCLFMDDDISCEVESIRRAYAVLSYSPDPKIGLAGVLLDAQKPWSVQEKGAEFHQGLFRPLHQNEEVRSVPSLLALEKDKGNPVYGGWWFFAFRLDAVDYYPFPFFVRGDDALFGLINRFNVFTLNGIACFSDHFLSKETAFTRYLGFRASLAVFLMEDGGSVTAALKLLSASFLWCALSYRYQSAKAITLALRDVSKGVSFWRRTLTYPPSLKEIGREQSRAEQAAYFTAHPFVEKAGSESRFRKMARAVTLNGHLLPDAFIRKTPVYVGEYTPGLLSSVFLRQRVIYRKYETQSVFEEQLNRKTFWDNVWAFAWHAVWFAVRFRALARDYRANAKQLCSEHFWRSVYAQKKP